MKNKDEDIVILNRNRCINALVLSCIVIIAVFIGVVTKLVAPSTLEDPDEGIRAFRYFTVLSNMFMAFTATLCIPYEIDGLRKRNYHLPRWVVEVLYIGVCVVTITFSVAFCLLSPVAGFSVTMLQKANLYLHLISPVTSMILFILINDDHRLSFKHTFLVLIPIFAYSFVYWYEVFVIGAENGGWRDHYYTNVFFPYWVALFAMPIIGFSLASLVRVLHNRRHAKHKKETEDYYLFSKEFECKDIKEAVAKLAIKDKKLDEGGDIAVPRRLLLFLKERYKSDLSLDELCDEYLAAYLRKD